MLNRHIKCSSVRPDLRLPATRRRVLFHVQSPAFYVITTRLVSLDHIPTPDHPRSWLAILDRFLASKAPFVNSPFSASSQISSRPYRDAERTDRFLQYSCAPPGCFTPLYSLLRLLLLWRVLQCRQEPDLEVISRKTTGNGLDQGSVRSALVI